MTKPTLVLGASLNPARVSHQAVHRLRSLGHEVHAFGRKAGQIAGIDIITQIEEAPREGVHTLALYLNARNQEPFYPYILDLRPQRIFFNPGTENPEFLHRARQVGIECREQCMMVAMSLSYF